MSDGPWKSLPMRPHWKQVAKQAENEAFSLEELSKALFVALLKEAEELPLDAVWRAVMPNDQGDLFGPDLDRKIKALERDHAGSKLVQKLLNCLRYQKAMGSSGREMAVSAVADTLDECAHDHLRAVLEHYYRKSHSPTVAVRSRLDSARDLCDFQRLASGLAPFGSPASSPSPARRFGLDDGPSL